MNNLKLIEELTGIIEAQAKIIKEQNETIEHFKTIEGWENIDKRKPSGI
jgi:hypothetical protein